ncbi:MAG: Crp/Fnr family transcriptional regulator [Sphaerochaeta sp.]|jgi:CRP-like cAMP-binding protein|nr:Crp/Fnr family transcriptional regulator [Sphaerochaeta sp.]MCI2076407.1 Crp/Fnr family transcriptional regulator [Sphaerochaeta sp.]MCI2096603.1 Crp/Fnr family transcriptional regulator [Sphaerochaeta sp.]MCI2103548.1 Crp/Fnr family transcriptional regulator [Sphaerochaeta sp.]MCI2128988.1 Crp/Fnr family transcriptional regulator [Sphaerochaeta sp.]
MTLFHGITTEELQEMYGCLGMRQKRYAKDQAIWHSGTVIRQIAIVIQGTVYIKSHDIWDREGIIGTATEGDVFGEAYACAGEPLAVEVTAATECVIQFLSLQKVFTPCGKACAFHSRLIANLLSIMASKNLMLTGKIKDISPRTIRERVLSYLYREAVRQHAVSFEIPFNRQQLADYLCVDRSALSSTLSQLEKEGVLYCDKNSFILKRPDTVTG